MHGRREPSGLVAKKTGAPLGEEDLRMNPRASLSSSHDRRAANFVSDKLEVGRGRCGCKASAADFEKAARRS